MNRNKKFIENFETTQTQRVSVGLEMKHFLKLKNSQKMPSKSPNFKSSQCSSHKISAFSKSSIFNFLILVIIILLFLMFLIYMPSMINKDDINSLNNKEEIKIFSESSNFLEENKFNYIASEIIRGLKNDKIQDNTNKYILDLISNNKIDNIENTIGQEIINSYLNNDINKAQLIALNFVENKLNLFDLKEDRKWRNEVLYLIDGNQKIILYENTPLMKSVYQAQIVGLSSVKISPYEYQIYNFTLNNDSYDTITINLFTKESNGNLSDYLGIENQNKYKNINSTFIESERFYEFKFIIWK